MYVVEITRVHVGHAVEDNGLELLGEHRLERVGHQSNEQERAVITNGVRGVMPLPVVTSILRDTAMGEYIALK